MTLKQIAAGAALVFTSTASFAGATANAGAFSEYMFRGVHQSGGAAVQGGVDWSSDVGVYAGTWISNTDFAGWSSQVSYETDVYGGWTRKWGDFGLDVGGLFYYYRDDTRLNTFEVYAAALLGPATIKVSQTVDGYFGAENGSGGNEQGTYIMANYAFPFSDTLTLTPQVGYSKGKGVRDFIVALYDSTPDDDYIDYSVTLAKTIQGFTFSLALVGTSGLDGDLGKEKEKIVVGLKKTFDL